MTSTAPEVTVTDELPGNAFVIIEKPGHPVEIIAGSEAARRDALLELERQHAGTEIIQPGDAAPPA